MANAFLQSVKPPVKPTRAPVGSTSPNYVGKTVGLMSNLIKAPAPVTPQNQNNSFLGSYMGAQAKAPEQNVKPPVTTIPTTQVKTTPTKPTGTSTQAPITPPPTVGGNNSSGTQNPNYNVQPGVTQGSTPQPQTTTQNTTPPNPAQPPQYTANSGLYGQLIAGLANRSTQPSPEYQQAYGQYQKGVSDLENFNKNLATAYGNIESQPIPLEFQQGREQVLARQAAGTQGALATALQGYSGALGAANSQQGLLQTAMQQAAAGAAPSVMSGGQYQMSPLGGGATDPAQGQATGFAAGSRAAVAQQNDSQATQHQANADAISSKLQVIAPTKEKLVSFMQRYSINGQPLPILNQQINTINAQTQPDAYNTMQLAIGDITSFTQQILQAQGGITPTDAGNIVSSWAQNMQNMTPVQLQQFTSNIEALGNIRLAQEQASAKAARDANQTGGGAPAQGMDANTSAQLQRAQESILNNLPDWAKAGAGIIGNYGPSLGQAAAGAAEGYALGGVSGGAAGAVLPGVASKFFQ